MKLKILGCISAASYAVHSILSWPMAASIGHSQPEWLRQGIWFKDLSSRFPSSLNTLGQLFSEKTVFALPEVFLWTYSLPLLVQTLCFAAAVWFVQRVEESRLQIVRDKIMRWAIVFAVISLPAFNVLTPDIWLSVIWGRMILHGLDPYVIPFLTSYSYDTPLVHQPIPMTYGPLWALISATVCAVALNSGLAAWVMFKIIILAAFIGCLRLVSKLAASLGLRRQTIAILCLGWLPVGVHTSVAEGHNDVVMIYFLLLWLYYITSPTFRAPISFFCAVAIKYVAAPLVLLDALYTYRRHEVPLKTYLLRGLPAAVIAIPFAIFMISGGRLSQTLEMGSWHFLEPADLLRIPDLFGVYIPGRNLIMKLLFVIVAALALRELWINAVPETLFLAALAMLSLLLFAIVGHVWPWFYIWVLPLAVMIPGRLLSVFVLTSAVVAPFSLLGFWGIAILDRASPWMSTLLFGPAFVAAGYRVWQVYRAHRASGKTDWQWIRAI